MRDSRPNFAVLVVWSAGYASAKSWSTRRASYQSTFMDSCLTVDHTRFHSVYLVDELIQGVLQTLLMGPNGSPGIYLSMVYFYSYGELVLF